jgi:outer membrane protein assembly factor BamD (BamD/ComL family)
MKKFLLITYSAIALLLFSLEGSAQKQIEPQIQRDPILEADALHNLDVARQYFKNKKAYKAVLMRFEETFAANPEFSRMDEFLYLAGMSSYYLSVGKGKQKINAISDDEKKRFAPERLRSEAIEYLKILIENYPQSGYKAEAEKSLEIINGKK